jgi:hypothetical protein
MEDTLADPSESLELLHRDSAPKVEQGARQRLQDHFIATAYESDPIALLEIQ